MNARILRIELRRSAARWAALAVAAVGTALLYLVVNSWGGAWLPLAADQREQLYVVWPVALGAGAWQARRESRARIGELLATTPRPRWQRVAPTAVALALGAVAGYLAMFAAGAAQVAPAASYFPAGSLLVVAVGALTMVGAVWLGMAIGSLLSTPLTPPALTVGGFAVLMGVPTVLRSLHPRDPGDLPGATLLSPVLTPPLTDFYAVTTRVGLVQLVWFTALAATAFGLYAAATRRTRLAALAPSVLGAVLALAVLPTTADAAYVPDPGAYAPVCDPGPPRVCVARVHATALADLRAPARQALAALAAKLPGAPTTVAEARNWWIEKHLDPQRPDTVLVDLNPDADGRLGSPRELLWELVDGAGTRACSTIFDSAEPDAVARHHAARLAAAAWLLDQAPPADAYHAAQARQAWETLRTLPADEQLSRVAALRASALACDGRDLLDVLVGTGSR
ncbi:hypothetical protein ACNTMW_04065 [Planosporangium sp. 12N6]|uniref:hypothetical protein n=1 Tax=Planosporangium spinosum TaxID=3402278 RepID=UPI003CE694E5